MKLPLPADTFPVLAISPEDKRTIEAVAEAVVKRTSAQYHEHLTVHKGVVDEKHWKKIRHREDVRVYRERVSSFDAHEATSNSSESSAEDGAAESVLDGRTVASMLTVGSIPGKLDDVMYGVLNPTLEEMRLKTAYVEDGFVDWALLAPIIKPTEDDPFRELGIKWTVKSNSMLLGTVMRLRDALYIESTGFALTPNGERIGYHLYHSVDVPGIRELDEFEIVRSKVSVCDFYRQRNASCVEVYSRFVINPMGDVPTSMMATTASEIAVSVFRHVHCAEMKKLARVVISSQQSPQRSTHSTTDAAIGDAKSLESSSSSSSDSKPSSIDLARLSLSSKKCALCAQDIGGGLSFSKSKKDKNCRICSARVCSRCRVAKTLHLPTKLEKELSAVSVTVCTRCLRSTSNASSAKFAVLDVHAAEGRAVDYRDALH